MKRGPQWSPSLERKRQEEAKQGKKKEERRKTLAELALEAGYTVSTVRITCYVALCYVMLFSGGGLNPCLGTGLLLRV